MAHDRDHKDDDTQPIRPGQGRQGAAAAAAPATEVRPRGGAPLSRPPEPKAPPPPAINNDRTIIHSSRPRGAESAETEVHRYGDRPTAPAVSPSAPPSQGGGAGLAAHGTEPAEQPSPLEPVVGWLVVVDGAGRGQTVPFYSGMNSVGREIGQRVRIAFGDQEISREGHFFVTYEPKKRTFHLNHGGRTNLVYHNGDALLAPVALSKGDMIEVGKTKLMFVPLCGPDFSWDE